MTQQEFRGRLLKIRILCQKKSESFIFNDEEAELVMNARRFVNDNENATNGYGHRMEVANKYWQKINRLP